MANKLMLRLAMSALTAVFFGAIGDAQAQQSTWGPGANNAAFDQMLKTGFQDSGQAKVSRLVQDDIQAFCSDPKAVETPEGAKRLQALEAASLATIKWPADNQWLGDWKAGETLAQSGRGLTWSDQPSQGNGGNCYNCHQISPAEISFGTIGPSLYLYGKNKGDSDQVRRETWSKIFNAKYNNACSNMPRFGHMGILSEKNIQDLMALLLSPDSPVNK